jgi:hypothetical protein
VLADQNAVNPGAWAQDPLRAKRDAGPQPH